MKIPIPAAVKIPQRWGISNIHTPSFTDEYVHEEVPLIPELMVNDHILFVRGALTIAGQSKCLVGFRELSRAFGRQFAGDVVVYFETEKRRTP